jgi:phosphoglycerate kinase
MAEAQRKPRLKLVQDTIIKYKVGGGDTLQELKNLCPGMYLNGFNDPECYYFSGGGTVLKALEQGSPFKIKPVERLLKQ